MRKVLGLALYSSLAASTRYRLGQYVSGLAEKGIDLQIRSLLSDEYLQRRYRGDSMQWADLLMAAAGRLRDLQQQSKFDAAILYSELFPAAPAFLERGLIKLPYIYDFDDAFYLKYSTGRWSALSPLMGQKIDRLIAGAAAVTPGNRTLAGYARRHHSNIHELPTVVDITRYVPTQRANNPVFTVGWIGSPSTAPYLSALVEPLQRLADQTPVKLVVIGGKAPQIQGVSVVEIEWQEHTEVELINSFDVGVMPLPDDDWARGKCAFKLIQYMACAVPVIASPVGANNDVVTQACGLLAASAEAWFQALIALRDDAVLRKDMGQAGRERVCSRYSLQGNLPVLSNVIHGVIGERP